MPTITHTTVGATVMGTEAGTVTFVASKVTGDRSGTADCSQEQADVLLRLPGFYLLDEEGKPAKVAPAVTGVAPDPAIAPEVVAHTLEVVKAAEQELAAVDAALSGLPATEAPAVTGVAPEATVEAPAAE